MSYEKNKIKNNIVQFRDRYENVHDAIPARKATTVNGRLPILFIMAKTYGASKAFVMEHQLENKLKFKFRDIIYLYNGKQLYGIDKKQIQVVSLPRHEESKYDLKIKEVARSRGIHIMSATKFLNLIKPDG